MKTLALLIGIMVILFMVTGQADAGTTTYPHTCGGTITSYSSSYTDSQGIHNYGWSVCNKCSYFYSYNYVTPFTSPWWTVINFWFW
jgi:hypothetical protein